MKILVTRFSAMGDVALTAPVLKSFIKKYPQHQIILFTRKPFEAFFEIDKRNQVITPDLDKLSVVQLIKLINSYGPFDIYIDLHNNLRTFFIRLFLKIQGTKVYFLDKQRNKKREIILRREVVALPHITLQYAEVFKKAGFPINLESGNILSSSVAKSKAIGIAPFAKHVLKEWGMEKMKAVADHFLRKGKEVYVFGGKENETEILQMIKECKGLKRPEISRLRNELEFISTLDLMICMDSSNMHFAALSGVKIVSVWGPTHPSTGFGPYNKDQSIAIFPSSEITCNPCSVYGNKSCKRNDHACMRSIKVEEVIKKAEELLGE